MLVFAFLAVCCKCASMEKETTAGCTNQIWAEFPLGGVSHAAVAYVLQLQDIIYCVRIGGNHDVCKKQLSHASCLRNLWETQLSSKTWSVFGKEFNGMLLKRQNLYYKWIAGILSIKAIRGYHKANEIFVKTIGVSWYDEGLRGLNVWYMMLLSICVS